MIRFITLLSCIILLHSESVYAESFDALEQLKLNNIEMVEEKYSKLQNKFELGEASEYDLLKAYKAFYKREDEYRSQLGAWIREYPNSPSAYLARGVYYRKLGEYRRGTSYISKVPKENIDYMKRMFSLSKKDLSMALEINPKSYHAILNLLNIAMFEGDDHAANKYLTMGNAVLPSNFIIRARYLINLTPKWGGSHKSMEKFIEECQAQGLSENKINMLNAILADDQGNVARERGDIELAHSMFVKALVLSRDQKNKIRKKYLRKSLRICREEMHKKMYYCLK